MATTISIGTVDKKPLKGQRKLAKKVLDLYPETKIKGKVVRPLFLRLIWGVVKNTI